MKKSELKALIRECILESNADLISEAYPHAYGYLLQASTLVSKAYKNQFQQYGKDDLLKQIEQVDKLLKSITLKMTRMGKK